MKFHSEQICIGNEWPRFTREKPESERVIPESTRAATPSTGEISCLNRGYCELDYFDIDIALQSWLGACNRTTRSLVNSMNLKDEPTSKS